MGSNWTQMQPRPQEIGPKQFERPCYLIFYPPNTHLVQLSAVYLGTRLYGFVFICVGRSKKGLHFRLCDRLIDLACTFYLWTMIQLLYNIKFYWSPICSFEQFFENDWSSLFCWRVCTDSYVLCSEIPIHENSVVGGTIEVFLIKYVALEYHLYRFWAFLSRNW